MADYVPTAAELRRAYVEASGATPAQGSYYAETVAEAVRGLGAVIQE